MAQDRQYHTEQLLQRPGTYFNLRTEVMVIVDDSPAIDQEACDFAEDEGGEWVLVSDELPLDDERRDQLLQAFQQEHGRPAETDELAQGYEADTEEPDI